MEETIPLDFLALIFLIFLLMSESVYKNIERNAFEKRNLYNMKMASLLVLIILTMISFIGIITKLIGLNLIQ